MSLLRRILLPNSRVVAIFIASLFLGSALGFAAAYVLYQPQLNRLQIELSSSRAEVSSLHSENALLEANQSLLEANYSRLRNDYLDLMERYSDLGRVQPTKHQLLSHSSSLC